MGAVVSALARAGLRPREPVTRADGFPVFDVAPDACTPIEAIALLRRIREVPGHVFWEDQITVPPMTCAHSHDRPAYPIMPGGSPGPALHSE